MAKLGFFYIIFQKCFQYVDLLLKYSFAAEDTFHIIIIINVENICAASYICENCDPFFPGFFDK